MRELVRPGFVLAAAICTFGAFAGPVAKAQNSATSTQLMKAQEGGYTAEVSRDGISSCSFNLFGSPPQVYTLSFVKHANGTSVMRFVVPKGVTLRDDSDNLILTIVQGESQRNGAVDVIVLPPEADGSRVVGFTPAAGIERALLEGDLTVKNAAGQTALAMKVPATLRSRALAAFDSCRAKRS